MESRFAARRELQQALLSWLQAAHADAGIAKAFVYEDVITPGVFGIELDVVTGAAMEAHVNSDAFGTLLGALNILADHVHMSISKLTSDFGPGSFGAIRSICIDDQGLEPSGEDSP